MELVLTATCTLGLAPRFTPKWFRCPVPRSSYWAEWGSHRHDLHERRCDLGLEDSVGENWAASRWRVNAATRARYVRAWVFLGTAGAPKTLVCNPNQQSHFSHWPRDMPPEARPALSPPMI